MPESRMKRFKSGIDEGIDEWVNQPLAKAGHEDLGAGISSVLSAGSEMLIPDSLGEAAMSAIPGAKLLQLAKKATRARKAMKAAEKTKDPERKKLLKRIADRANADWEKMKKKLELEAKFSKKSIDYKPTSNVKKPDANVTDFKKANPDIPVTGKDVSPLSMNIKNPIQVKKKPKKPE